MKKGLLIIFLALIFLVTACQTGNNNHKDEDSTVKTEKKTYNYNITDYTNINEITNNYINHISKYKIQLEIKETVIGEYIDGDYKTVVLTTEDEVKVTLKFDDNQEIVGIVIMGPYGKKVSGNYTNLKLCTTYFETLGIDKYSAEDEYYNDFIDVLTGLYDKSVYINGWLISSTLDTGAIHVFSFLKQNK